MDSGSKISVVRFSLWLAAGFISGGTISAQNTASDWFPIHVGDKWVYEHTSRINNGGGQAHPDVRTWRTEETTIGSWTIPEGTVVGRQVRVIEGSPPPDAALSPSPTLTAAPSPAYLIRGDCLYGPEYGEAGWNPSDHQLTPDFRKGLNVGWLAPDFCFPLVAHKRWGAPHGLPDWGVARPEQAKDWEVVGMEAHDPSAPDLHETFHVANISSYPGAGFTVDIWFEKGVGLVHEDDIHHGTIGEVRTRLLRYEPAPRR
jgi:hypothetical protein